MLTSIHSLWEHFKYTFLLIVIYFCVGQQLSQIMCRLKYCGAPNPAKALFSSSELNPLRLFPHGENVKRHERDAERAWLWCNFQRMFFCCFSQISRCLTWSVYSVHMMRRLTLSFYCSRIIKHLIWRFTVINLLWISFEGFAVFNFKVL